MKKRAFEIYLADQIGLTQNILEWAHDAQRKVVGSISCHNRSGMFSPCSQGLPLVSLSRLGGCAFVWTDPASGWWLLLDNGKKKLLFSLPHVWDSSDWVDDVNLNTKFQKLDNHSSKQS